MNNSSHPILLGDGNIEENKRELILRIIKGELRKNPDFCTQKFEKLAQTILAFETTIAKYVDQDGELNMSDKQILTHVEQSLKEIGFYDYKHQRRPSKQRQLLNEWRDWKNKGNKSPTSFKELPLLLKLLIGCGVLFVTLFIFAFFESLTDSDKPTNESFFRCENKQFRAEVMGIGSASMQFRYHRNDGSERDITLSGGKYAQGEPSSCKPDTIEFQSSDGWIYSITRKSCEAEDHTGDMKITGFGQSFEFNCE